MERRPQEAVRHPALMRPPAGAATAGARIRNGLDVVQEQPSRDPVRHRRRVQATDGSDLDREEVDSRVIGWLLATASNALVFATARGVVSPLLFRPGFR